MKEKQLDLQEMITEKLYYLDSHTKEFTARVLACEEGKKGYRIVLDKTAFFPEGGGQFGDIGFLNEIEVFDTREKNGIVYHETKEPIEVGVVVEGKLNFEERFSRMQQHTGEHILSGLVNKFYGYNNVGFHLGAEITTLDFDGELNISQIQELELLANRAVVENIPIEVSYPSKEELKTLEYRSKIEIEGQVRLVSIAGYDVCACCAPHTKTTGEIGMIKILSCERHRGGCRMSIVCGFRALQDYRKKQESVNELSVKFSAKPERIVEAVENFEKQLFRVKQQYQQLQAIYLEKKLEEITKKDRNFCIFEEEMDSIAMRNFINAAMERCEGICAAFIGKDGEYRYILGSKNVDLRAFSKKLHEVFQGKGGGKPEMIQGTLIGKPEEIEKWMMQQ